MTSEIVYWIRDCVTLIVCSLVVRAFASRLGGAGLIPDPNAASNLRRLTYIGSDCSFAKRLAVTVPSSCKMHGIFEYDLKTPV